MNLDLFVNSAMLQAITKGRHKVVEMAGRQVPRVRMRWNGPQGKSLVTLTGFGIQPYQMLAWGTQAVGVIKARVALGIGSDDSQMKPLSPRYKKFKTRLGLGDRRNLYFRGLQGGHMLDALRVTQATERTAKIDISTQQSRQEAVANEARSPWMGFSGRDTTQVLAIARQIFQQNIDAVRVGAGGRRQGIRVPLPVWMDPAAQSAAFRRAA